MKKLFVIAIAALLLPLAASASCTYTTDAGSSTTKSVCTTTTEAAPTLVTEGRSLDGLSGLVVIATASSAWTAGGKLNAYIWSPQAAAWVRAPDFDLTVPAATGQAWAGFFIPVPNGRIDYKPAGVGAVTTTIYMIGARP
jgi:hypothetical protein